MKRFSYFFAGILIICLLALPASAVEPDLESPDVLPADSADVSEAGVEDRAEDGPVLAAEPDTPLSDVPTDDSADVPESGAEDGSALVVDAGGGSVLCSGADVTVDLVQHDTISVPSVIAPGSDGVELYADADTADSARPLADVIRGLFGTYTPRTQLVTTYYDGQVISSDEQVIPGLAGLDWEWIAGVVIFALILFCLFRLLGGALARG